MMIDYHQILQNISDAVVCLNQRERILFFNQSAEQMFGYTAAETTGKPLSMLLEAGFADQSVAELVGKRKTTAEFPHFSSGKILWGIHKNNNTFPIEVCVSETIQGDDQAIFTLTFRDLTDQIEIESAFRERNQELMVLNNASRYLIASLDIDEVLMRILDEVRRLLDVEACSVWLLDLETNELVCEQITDAHAHGVIGWRLPSGVGNAGWVIANKRSLIVPDAWHDDRHYQGIDEYTRHYIRSILTVPLGEGDEVIGVIQMVDTFPNRFTKSNLELMESLSAFATIAIENARLYAALKEAQERLVTQERFAALGQMAATVAHELRNPLMAIRMGVDYLLQGVDKQDSRWHGAALMKTNMNRIDRLVEDILYVGRIQETALAPGWLRPLIAAEVERWQLTLVEHQITLQAELAPSNDLLPVLLHKEHVTRAVSNLIANSADVLPPGGKIVLSFSQEDGAQIIRISDNGPGVPPALMNRIFEPFFTTKVRGTGLGLSIVKRIIEQHHGSIAVESGLLEGTTFTIHLPVYVKTDE
jgi:two-component system, NtrC family, sensor histidine kinase HydH